MHDDPSFPSLPPIGRRDFLRAGALGGAAALAGGCAPAGAAAPPPVTPASVPASIAPFALEEVTVAELQEGMRSGRWTAHSITEAYLGRIEQIDRSGPTVSSILETNPEALEIAARLDAERAAGRVRGPLHGVPIVLKDNIDTADRMHTSAGSLALADWIPPDDAFLVRRLREAGAVILAKANLSEWANFRSSHSSSGWSGRGGQTRNPYVLDRNPCGSSSGSGAAVSANLTPLAIGTETDGSVVCPASACGVVGIKPTVGLVSRDGIIPISHSQDTAGPMCRSVTDAALLLGALAGVDPNDAATAGSRGNVRTDYTAGLTPDGLRGARLGVARNFFGFDPAVDAIMEESLRAMREAGAEIIDPTEFSSKESYGDSEFTVLLYEFKADLNTYLSDVSAGMPRSLAELIEFNQEHREREMPYFGQDIFVQAQEKGSLAEQEYRDALAKNQRLSRAEGVDAVLKEHRLDAILAPTGGPAWLTDLVVGDHFGGGSSRPAAVAGYPSVTVPAGYVFGLPVGISFIGTAWSEPALLKFAYAFEQATRVRRAPRFLPTVELT